jgi:hypothetical protein
MARWSWRGQESAISPAIEAMDQSDDDDLADAEVAIAFAQVAR